MYPSCVRVRHRLRDYPRSSPKCAQRVVAEADAVSARLSAEGNARIGTIKGAYEGRINQLMNSPAGRAYVGYNAADTINFSSELTFQSQDGLPSVLRLGEFARRFISR